MADGDRHRRLDAPRAPGPWVDADACECGALYGDHRAGLDWPEAVSRVRAFNGGHWWPSRGPVLWLLRVNKLSDWYFEHADCGRRPGRKLRNN